MTSRGYGWCALAVIALWGCSRSASTPASAGAEPRARVELAKLERGPLTELLRAYGTIVPAPGAARTVSRPFEVRVKQVLVSPGQLVKQGEGLIAVESSPDTQLQVNEAARAQNSAARLLESVRRRVRAGLSVNADLVAAERAWGDARARIQSFRARGAQGQVLILAESSGRVGQIEARAGALVAAGGPLLELFADDAMEARLGIEPEDLHRVPPGVEVQVRPVQRPGPGPEVGTLRVLTGAIAPDTRLVDALVTLPHAEQFLEGEYVTGDLRLVTRDALIAPRAAVLPVEGTWVLFTVEGDVARRRVVEIGLETSAQVEVLGSDLKPGDAVVVVGGYELTDGMKVQPGPR